MFSNLASPADALATVLRIAGVGIVVASCELLAVPAATRRGGLLAAEVPLTRRSWMVRRPWVHRSLLVALGDVGGRVLLVVRAVAALVVVIQPGGLTDSRWAVLVCAITTLALRLRTPTATHASGAMSVIVVVSAAAALLIGTDRAYDISLWFIACEAWLSYFCAGASKAAQPSWRRGDAIVAILSTTLWGSRRAVNLMVDQPRLALSASWLTILGECSIPLTLVLPLQVGVVLLAIALLFHVITAFEMGLNNFVWMFPATYPAIIFAWHFAHG